MFQLTAEELAGIVAVVVGFTEMIKLSKYVPEKYGLGIAAVMAALGILAYVSSKPEVMFTRVMIWPFISAYLVVLTAAAGVYGVIRESRGGDVMDGSRQGFDGTKPPSPPPVAMLALFLLPALALSGCTKTGVNTSPERTVAIYGTRVAGYLAEVQTSSANLYAKQVINKDQYDKVLTALIEVNKAGERLGDALIAYDAATDVQNKTELVEKIDGALIAIGTLLPGILQPVTNEEARARISQGIIEVQRLLITIARLTAPKAAAIDPGHNPECILRTCFA